MKINIADILAQDLGYNRQFNIEGEALDLELVKLTSPVNGEFTVFRSESGLLVSGRIETDIELECHRCLTTFERHIVLNFSQPFSEQPSDDEMPIVGNEIDLAPTIEQEIVVSLPIKQLCEVDCAGIPGVGKDFS
jgi:uncharacterized protein